MRRLTTVAPLALVALLLVPTAWTDDDKGSFEGSIEMVYRNVSLDGSRNKYNEDFDGLSSGTYLGHLSANWLNPSQHIDYARLDLSGLGGEPYESAAFRMGRKDSYELSLNHFKQDYIYDLFELTPDEDGSSWDTERQQTRLKLTLHPTDTISVFAQVDDGRRTGDSVSLKDISRQLFRLDSPLDVTNKKYTVGADFNLGSVDLFVRQTLRSYANDFVAMTESNSGVEPGVLTSLERYDWRQDDVSKSQLTTVKLSAPLHDRIDLDVSIFGTLLGDEEFSSRVAVDAEGTDFLGAPLSIVGGFANTDLEGDTLMADVALAFELHDRVDLLLDYRTVDREMDGTITRDLDGTGAIDTVAATRDYTIDTTTATLEYRPMRELNVRLGYRSIDRELTRDGFDSAVRNLDFTSNGDDSIVIAFVVKPVDWFRLNADYEDGDVTQPFTAVGFQETERYRARAVFTPKDNLRIDVGYLDFDNFNLGVDIRGANTIDGDPLTPDDRWISRSEGDTWSASVTHKPNDVVDYMFRYAQQSIESGVGVAFDTAGFFGVDQGSSIFDNDNTQYAARINLDFEGPWSAHLDAWYSESDGDNLICGVGSGFGGAANVCEPLTVESSTVAATTTVNRVVVDQQLTNYEAGVTHTWPSGLFAGLTLRVFDYDDGGLRVTNDPGNPGTPIQDFRNNLNYDGEIFMFRIGTRF